jgi:uncharacterized membrane protein YfcA
MAYLLICVAAIAASALTFFSGFGLGTLLLPVFALFVPIDQAVVFTAIVHFINSLFKLSLVGSHADRRTVLRFGLPAILAALLGAWVLQSLSHVSPILRYGFAGRPLEITFVKLVIGTLLLVFAILEATPWFQRLQLPPALMPIGGAVSGFLGGLSGMQGALRSVFLLRAGLSKESFIATGVVIACLVDLSRLSVYVPALVRGDGIDDILLLVVAAAAACGGALIGARVLTKATYATVQRVVAAMLVAIAIGLITGVV